MEELVVEETTNEPAAVEPKAEQMEEGAGDEFGQINWDDQLRWSWER